MCRVDSRGLLLRGAGARWSRNHWGIGISRAREKVPHGGPMWTYTKYSFLMRPGDKFLSSLSGGVRLRYGHDCFVLVAVPIDSDCFDAGIPQRGGKAGMPTAQFNGHGLVLAQLPEAIRKRDLDRWFRLSTRRVSLVRNAPLSLPREVAPRPSATLWPLR